MISPSVVTATGSSRLTSSCPLNVCTTPCEAIPIVTTNESGINTYKILLVTSTKKLPSPLLLTFISPLTKAYRTAIPVAADVKFCTVNPKACDK